MAAQPPMAEEESGQERTLEPSQRRLDQARREGQLPRSRDLAHLMVLGGASGLLFLFSTPLLNAGLSVVTRGLTFDARLATDSTRLGARLGELGAAALLAVLPVFGVMLVAALLAPLAVGGWNFAPEAARPKFERMSPLKGLARMFSPAALVELSKVMLLALLLGAVGAWYVAGHLETFAGLAHESLPAALSHFGWLFLVAFALLAATIAAIAAIDVPFQIMRHRKRLRMTPEEAKREHKETEGDPAIKARVRNAQRALARKRMMAAVPKADVVVTNPTHFAVALKYIEGRHGAPVVVAKGIDAVAERIKELARENNVPQLEAPPLARALYKHVEIGAEIPAALYTAVAQVLAYVFQLKRYAQGIGPRPTEPRGIEVPEGMDPLAPRALA
jgi:flagellar biosynthetic protein FlhB